MTWTIAKANCCRDRLAQVHFKTPAMQTFVIPVSAIIFRRDGTQVGTVGNDNVAHLLSVTIGQDDGATVQIVSGLKEADRVIQDPPDSLIEGEKVNPRAPSGENQTSSREPGANSDVSRDSNCSVPLGSTAGGASRVRGMRLLGVGLVGIGFSACRMQGRAQLSTSCDASAAGVQGGWDRQERSCRRPILQEERGSLHRLPMACCVGNWWEIYQDPQLNALEEQIAPQNQNLRAAMEAYLSARDQVRVARADFYPTLSVTPESPAATRYRRIGH